MDISGFLTRECEYIYREPGKTHGDMFGSGELKDIHDYDTMCSAGILRIGFIGETLCIDGYTMSSDQYFYLRNMVGNYSWIRKIFVDDGVLDIGYSRQDFLATNRYIK